MGFILQKVFIYHKSRQADRTMMRAQSAAFAGLAVTFRPSLNPSHRLDHQHQTSTFMHGTAPTAFQLPAPAVVLRRSPGCRGLATLERVHSPPLPSAPRLESPRHVHGHVRPLGQHLWVHIAAVSSSVTYVGRHCWRTLSRQWYWVWHTCARASPSTRRCRATFSAPIMSASNCPSSPATCNTK
jgi:hypothetical protein